jgi:hypothetical protein
MRSEGKEPPPFLVYLFFPKGMSARVPFPRPLRVIVGFVISLGGAALLVLGATIFAAVEFAKLSHPIAAAVVLVLFAALGVPILYVGFRLMVAKDDEPLMKLGKRAN